jgi:predicted nucleic acid-binding protein
MLSDLPLVYWDSCVPLSYVNEIPERVQHISPMLKQSGKDFQIVTSVLSIVEVAFASIEQNNKALDPEQEERIATLWRPGSPIVMVEFYEVLAYKAQALMRAALPRGWSLRGMDALHLATADRLKVSAFHTYDERLDKFSEITDSKFPITRPISGEPHLRLASSEDSTPPTSG